ncbi:hypothetical protein P7K49_002211 [Saguinus oedipus]|uniref:Uncharacterized protein n=1 Tax=Saguinus oedipus TaxID=9490 RepID=A0ABQ9WHA2_SAGOE|nr:hypothetical protein P7K49_002211 [Saguinus oedipus]
MGSKQRPISTRNCLGTLLDCREPGPSFPSSTPPWQDWKTRPHTGCKVPPPCWAQRGNAGALASETRPKRTYPPKVEGSAGTVAPSASQVSRGGPRHFPGAGGRGLGNPSLTSGNPGRV